MAKPPALAIEDKPISPRVAATTPEFLRQAKSELLKGNHFWESLAITRKLVIFSEQIAHFSSLVTVLPPGKGEENSVICEITRYSDRTLLNFTVNAEQ